MANANKGYLEGRIDLDDINVVDVTLSDSDDCKISKRLSLNEYISVLSDQSGVWQDIPKLPMGTLRVLWKDSATYNVAIYVPRDVRPTLFIKRGKPIMIPYPNMVFFFEIKNKRMIRSCCYSVKESFEAMNENTKLYQYPYGNVSEAGQICWGGNNVSDVETPMQLSRTISIFFDAATNTDLYVNGMSCKKDCPLEELLEMFNGKDRFDEELLQENGKTLGSLFKK